MKKLLNLLIRILGVIIGATILTTIMIGAYYYGYVSGYNNAAKEVGEELALFKINIGDFLKQKLDQPTPTPMIIEKTVYPKVTTPTWTGPELWDLVNKKRQEYGVNPLSNKSELCTIASIRLNELLALGTLDGHEGFSKMPDTRPDLKWVFEKYNLTEFLVSGAQTASEAVSLWDNTLGHRKLLAGGEYVWGCIYAQDGFGVAITAY
jgi:hypothetical protein